MTVEVGNSDKLAANANISSFTSYHVPGVVYDTAVGTTGTTTKVTIDAGTLTDMNVTVDVGQHRQNPERADGVDAAVRHACPCSAARWST